MARKAVKKNTNLLSIQRGYMQLPVQAVKDSVAIISCTSCFDKTVYNPSYDEARNGARPASGQWRLGKTGIRTLCPACEAAQAARLKNKKGKKNAGDGSGSGDAAAEPDGHLRDG